MAYWIPLEGVSLSNHILNKRITIGSLGHSNIIRYQTQYTIPSDEYFERGGFETVTAYMPGDFSDMYTFNPDLNQFQTIEGGETLVGGSPAQPFPLIFSTNNGSHAMGIVAPFHPAAGKFGQTSVGVPLYGRWSEEDPGFVNIVKWNTGYIVNNPHGTYHFDAYVIVGTLQTVKNTMQSLFNTIPLCKFYGPLC